MTAAPRTFVLTLFAALATSSGCERTPEADDTKVDPPADAQAREQHEALKREAHKEALAAALRSGRSVFIAADPLGAYAAGRAPAAPPPLSLADRQALRERLEIAKRDAGEIDERYLDPPEVVILRTLRFGLTRLYDELERHPQLRLDPQAGLRAVAETLDELEYRLLGADCDAACLELPAGLAADLPTLRDQLEGASLPALSGAKATATQLAARARGLAQRSAGVRGEDLDDAQGEALARDLAALAAALDEHAAWLATAEAAVPKASASAAWTDEAPPLRPGGVEELVRMPAHLGARALRRRLSVGERVDLDLERAVADGERFIGRWEAIETQLIGAETSAEAVLAEDPAAPPSVARCEALVERIREDLAAVEEVAAPELDCARFVQLHTPEAIPEGALALEILDRAVIEPQRRKLRGEELPELALIRGRWSEDVHRHLRRIMLLSRIEHPQARAQAVIEGREALCLSTAALWIHAERGAPADLTLGPACAMLGDPAAIDARVSADPDAALTGFGLSLIGDEPARMVGFDRFFWAPLGLMKTLSTPPGMHPDAFVLPDDPMPAPEPAIDVKVETFGADAQASE
ncbi:hypothetical protein G6O69_30320 [Pseudenhygromyxa sp. WMMC2535]|uniref:hypothetical protein n=1 Tax=Pseudenhygromyxa sp. WMMC2535 TaxID=2712867 RepID=UPI0015541D2A|nr:hypothetical protein [Pseudenhygromyxa sp. WMMC2535]NVB42157.1 hypothetical protein [Pseudenhygromyxa sp. WMMC2535]